MTRFTAVGMVTALLCVDAVNLAGASSNFSDEEVREKYRAALREVRTTAERCQLASIVEKVDRLLSTWLKGANEMNVIAAMANSLVGDIQRELAAHMFFRIPKDERTFYEEAQLSESAINAFPSAVPEIQDAGRCFALDQPTAAVMHLMRALEVPLGVLISALNFTASNPNWQTIINECEREIRALKDKGKQEFYAQAATNFLYFKNAWRNHAMHGRDTYDKRQAFDIMMHVGGFMDVLSKKLCEPGGYVT